MSRNTAVKRRGRNADPRTVSAGLRTLFLIARGEGLRLCDLEELTGVNRNRLSEYRRGAVEPGFIRVEEMAAAMGFEIAFIRRKDG